MVDQVAGAGEEVLVGWGAPFAQTKLAGVVMADLVERVVLVARVAAGPADPVFPSFAPVPQPQPSAARH
jgi:hypothetical protein